MTKVLILTYYWPPGGGAGVQRWLKFVKYIRDYGWEPVVYTAKDGEMPVIDHSLERDVPNDITVIRRPIWEPYTLYKKFIGRKKDDKINASFLNENKKTGITEKISVWIRGNFFIPDARRFWIKPSVKFLTQYLVENKITHIISTGPPHSMHLIARGLQKNLPHLKWVADFRDPWTNIDFYSKLMLTKKADRKHHRLEREVLLNADLVLSIGHTMREEFKTMYNNAGGKNTEKFKVITNGFDADDTLVGPLAKDTKFSIAHIGTLVKDRNPDGLWRVLKTLVRENKDFASKLEIKLVGKVDLYVKEQIEHYSLTQYVNKIDYLPHDEVIMEQQRSKVLLLLVNNTKNAKGILTGKFFEYMASGVPILAIGPPTGDLGKIMEETRSGFISDFHDEVTLKKNILYLYSGEMPERDEARISLYSRKELTRLLCSELDAI